MPEIIKITDENENFLFSMVTKLQVHNEELPQLHIP